jgi:16S rRNA (uracil1498-N3)-methyltransferase
MRQFLLPDESSRSLSIGDELSFHGHDFHYLCRVLRLQPDDPFTATDGKGSRFELVVCFKKSNRCSARVTAKTRVDSDEIRIHLFQCIPKAKKMDDILRRAVQAGISSFTPVISRYSQVHVDDEKWIEKKRRWSNIAKEAFQQSGGVFFPEVAQAVRLDKLDADYLNKIDPAALRLYLHQDKIENISLHELLEKPPESIIIVIGPEGGLSDEEIGVLKVLRFIAIYLGARVLRTETASLYILSVIHTILREKDKWQLIRK